MPGQPGCRRVRVLRRRRVPRRLLVRSPEAPASTAEGLGGRDAECRAEHEAVQQWAFLVGIANPRNAPHDDLVIRYATRGADALAAIRADWWGQIGPIGT